MRVYQVGEGERQGTSIFRGMEYEAAHLIHYITGGSEELVYKV